MLLDTSRYFELLQDTSKVLQDALRYFKIPQVTPGYFKVLQDNSGYFEDIFATRLAHYNRLDELVRCVSIRTRIHITSYETLTSVFMANRSLGCTYCRWSVTLRALTHHQIILSTTWTCGPQPRGWYGQKIKLERHVCVPTLELCVFLRFETP